MEQINANILVVDDTPANLNLLGEILEEADYRVRKVPSGPLALKSVELELPDLILLDIKMSGMDGYAVCEELKADERYREIPVIFISALNNTSDKVKGFEMGGVDYITKPFEAEEVLVRVDTHVRLYTLQNELISARKEAETANLSKSAFLANMSHEIRTPMNSIINFTALCQQGKIPPREKDYLQKVSMSANYLLRLINDILDFSKIEAGKLKLESIDFMPEEIMEKAVSCMRVLTGLKKIELRINVQEKLPSVCGDPLRFEQVLINLLGNAIKFTDGGRIEISASTLLANDGSIILEVSVQDTGIGMDEETMKRLFKSFSQADISTTRHYGGTGLGLAICKQLVELMDGEIRVESKPGQGSVFSFIVRLKPGAPLSDTGVLSIKPIDQGLASIRNARVLLVEDNCLNQLLAKEILSRKQFRVDIASNGRQAVKMSGEALYDCIIMDVQMPVMDGYEATREIRKNDRYLDCPIIAMTASAMEGDREKCLEAGMDFYLTKPLIPEQLFTSMIEGVTPPIDD